MKSAIYIEDGITQIALTAESAWEKAVLAQIDGQELTVMRGGFYECRGGWVRQSSNFGGVRGDLDGETESVLLRINKTTTT